jgi:hypothetical protein
MGVDAPADRCGRAKVAKGAYTVYKALLELLGLRQLDVYRKSRGSPSDVIRVLEPSSRKVINIDLGTTRESLTYEEFLAKVKEAAEKQGIRISDRSWSTAMAKIKSMKGRAKASQA